MLRYAQKPSARCNAKWGSALASSRLGPIISRIDTNLINHSEDPGYVARDKDKSLGDRVVPYLLAVRIGNVFGKLLGARDWGTRTQSGQATDAG